MVGFEKKGRSSFEYWFAHWCAFQMTALNLHIWKPKYLLHDIEKPWLMLLWEDYKRVQHWHRFHNKHHVQWISNNTDVNCLKFDIDAMIIDNECSRFTKIEAPLTAIEFISQEIAEFEKKHPDMVVHNDEDYNEFAIYHLYNRALARAKELGLEK